MTTDTRSAADPAMPKSTRRNVLAGLAASAVAISASGAAPVDPDAELTRLAAELAAYAERVKVCDAQMNEFEPVAVYEEHEALATKCDELSTRIREVQAHGVAGIAAKAVALAWDTYLLPRFAADPDEMDWEVRQMFTFITSLNCMVASEARS